MANTSSKLPEEDRADIGPDLPGLRSKEGMNTNTAGGRSWGAGNSTGTGSGGAGNSTGASPGGATSGTGDKKGLYNDPSSLKNAEESAGDDDNGRLGKGYTPSPQNSNSTRRGRTRFRITRRKALVGGSITGGVVGVVFTLFSVATGPLQLVHLSEILQRNLHSQNEDSKVRLGRLFRYARSGSYGETRVGKLGSVTFGRTIEQLKAVGIEINGDALAHAKSVTIETEKLSKSYPELKGMSRAEARTFVADKLGVSESQLGNLGSGSDVAGHKFSINTRNVGIKTTRVLIKNSLDALDNGKVITAVKFRVMTRFLDLPNLLHPIKKLKTSQEIKATTGVEAKKRAKAEEERQKETQKRLKELYGAPAEDSLKEKIKGKHLVASALIATAGLCLVRSIADDVVAVNRASIVLPTVVQATDKIAVGEQVKSGQDLSADQAGGVVESFKDDSTGKTIWPGKALQATAGMDQSGEDISHDYKQAFSNDTTAQNIKDTIGSPKIAGVDIGWAACSKVGVAIQGAAGLALALGSVLAAIPTGGASVAAEAGSVAAKTAATAGIMYALEHAFTNLLKDKAIVPAVLSGAAGGNLLAYGAREAGNTSARASGGIELSNQETAMLDKQQQMEEQQQFRSESFFARMFNTKDYRSMTGRLADSLSPSLTQNVATVSNSFMNIGSMLPHVFSSLIPKAHAADKPYDWGFPKYGIPASIMNDPSMDDPYKNAESVAAVLDSTGGTDSDYVKKAKKCFGVEISKGTDGWDATPTDQPVNPNSDEFVNAHCDISDTGWKQVILFVFDSNTMKAAACYQSDTPTSDQSCQDLGFNSSADSSSTPSGDTPAVSGSSAELAKKLLDSKNVTPQPNPKSSLEAAAQGNKSPAGIDKCGVQHPPVALDDKLLAFLVDLSQEDAYTINSLTTGAHSCTSNHYKGVAVDFGCDVDTAKADKIGKKYGISHNDESCSAGVPHWHYSIGGG